MSERVNNISSHTTVTTNPEAREMKRSVKMCASKSLRMKLLRLSFSALCLGGAVYQISELAAIYFAYATSSIVELKVPTEYRVDSLTYCTRYIDVFSFERMNKDFPLRNWTRALTERNVRKYQSELTISDILKYTPREEEFIDHAEFRRAETFQLFQCDDDDCEQFFTVKRFIYLEYICYTVDANYRDEVLTYEALTTTPAAAGQIVEIIISRLLQYSFLIKIVSHTPNVLPYAGLQNVPVKQRFVDHVTKEADLNAFVSSAIKLNIHRLRPPYDTMCRDYSLGGFERRYDAIQACVKKHTLRLMHKMPFSVIINESLDLKIVSYYDLENHTVSELVLKLHSMCTAKNSREDCSSEISFTVTSADAGNRIGLKLITATSPFTRITVVTKTTFVQLLSIAMSTASTWTGFAVISLSPIFWYPQLKNMISQLAGYVSRAAGIRDTGGETYPPPRDEMNLRQEQAYLSHVSNRIHQLEGRVRFVEMKCRMQEEC